MFFKKARRRRQIESELNALMWESRFEEHGPSLDRVHERVNTLLEEWRALNG